MKVKIVTVLVVAIALGLVLAVPASAARWRLNLGGGYGSSSPQGIAKINQLIQECNTWAENTFGLSDFAVTTIEESIPVYSGTLRVELGEDWEVGLTGDYFAVSVISHVEKEFPTPVAGGMEKVTVIGSARLMGFSGNLLVYRKFKIKEFPVVPFVGVGIGYRADSVNMTYDVWDETYIPPRDWYWKGLNESFSASSMGSMGFVLAGGVVYSLGEHFRISMEGRYHSSPPLKGEITSYSEGSPSLPIEPGPFEVDVSGLVLGIVIMLRF